MEHELDSIIEDLQRAQQRLKDAIDHTRAYGDREAIWLAVDLGHAQHEVKRAISYASRYRHNGYKIGQWQLKDEVTA